jgi:hypothetical protein
VFISSIGKQLRATAGPLGIPCLTRLLAALYQDQPSPALYRQEKILQPMADRRIGKVDNVAFGWLLHR